MNCNKDELADLIESFFATRDTNAKTSYSDDLAKAIIEFMKDHVWV
jgi:hypothetical protein